jgi:hypothetical protein
MSAY